jgi:tetratricopeptide (TPR) repeat protein
VKIDPKFAMAWNYKGIALVNLNRTQEAVEAFDNATKADSKYSEAWNNLGLTLNAVGRYQDAVNAFDKAIATKGAKSS